MRYHHGVAMEKEPVSSYNAPLERVFDRIITPFEEFIHRQTTSGYLLMGCAIIALILANSALHQFYEDVLNVTLSIAIGELVLAKSLHHWINDGLMALFFFVVGLEIKREILVGELSDPRQAALPIIAAAGGMLMPATIYALINADSSAINGWGIPMATDIAFAVGALVLLGARVPKSLITFLVALAIVDDLGSVAVIALFYTAELDGMALSIGIGLLALLVGFNLAGIRKPLPYFLIGGLLWLAMLKSGVHATIAGVLTAFTIPARPKYEPAQFGRRVRALLDAFDRSYRPGESIMNNDAQRSILQTLENGAQLAQTPLQRLEHMLHLPVAYLIIPLFALANAGIPLSFDGLGQSLVHPVTLGVMAGLVFGKILGIAGFSWLAIKLGVGRLPEGVDFRQLFGVSLLGGIGFTMSIFIAELAFGTEPQNLLMAKTGILLASLLAGVAGYLYLRRLAPPLARQSG